MFPLTCRRKSLFPSDTPASTVFLCSCRSTAFPLFCRRRWGEGVGPSRLFSSTDSALLCTAFVFSRGWGGGQTLAHDRRVGPPLAPRGSRLLQIVAWSVEDDGPLQVIGCLWKTHIECNGLHRIAGHHNIKWRPGQSQGNTVAVL